MYKILFCILLIFTQNVFAVDTSKLNCIEKLEVIIAINEKQDSWFNPIPRDISKKLRAKYGPITQQEIRNQEVFESLGKWKNRVTNVLKTVIYGFKGIPSGFHMSGGKGFFGKFWRISKGVVTDWIVPLAHFLKPVPTPESWGRGETHYIFRKLWDDHMYVPNAKEQEQLAKYKSIEYYLDMQKFYLDFPNYNKFRKAVRTSALTARYLTTAGVGLFVYEQINSGLLNYEEFIHSEEFAIKPNQVQIIMETVPFPHTALRIGHMVFSYGVSHMSVKPVAQYLQTKQFQDAMINALKRKGKELKIPEKRSDFDGPIDWSMYSAGEIMGTVMQKTGLNKLPRSVQVVTLNLTVDQVRAIKAHLVKQTVKKYENETFVNDCTTMILKALEKYADLPRSRIWDASPTQSNLVFGLMKVWSDKVGPIYQVILEGEENHLQHLIRNSYINILESYIFIEFFYFNQTLRLFHDGTISEEEVQFHDKGFRDFLHERMKSFEQSIPNEQEFKFIQDDIRRFNDSVAKGLDPEVKKLAKADLIESIDFYLDRKISRSKSVIDSANSDDLVNILYHEFRLTKLEDLERSLKSSIKD